MPRKIKFYGLMTVPDDDGRSVPELVRETDEAVNNYVGQDSYYGFVFETVVAEVLHGDGYVRD